MTPWSVTATAGLSCSAALPTRSRMRDAPSKSANAVWWCRWTQRSRPTSPPPGETPPDPPPLEELQWFLDDEWSDEGYRDPGEESLYKEHARQVLTDYYRENSAHFRIPAALEFRFTIEIEGVAVSGVIDRMDRIPGGG